MRFYLLFYQHKYILWIFIFLPFLSYGQIKNVDYWENRFLKSWNKEYKKAIPMSKSNDSWQFYNLAYYIDANVAMYRSTKNLRYIDRAIEYTLNMINSAVPSSSMPNSQYKDSYYGWANFSAPSYKNDGKEYALFESYAWRYVSDLLYTMYKNNLNHDPTYKIKYVHIFNFTVENIYNKWLSRGENNLYRSNTHMMSHWVKISMNLYLITGKKKYKEIIDVFLNKFKKKINSSKRGNYSYLKWKSAWKSNSSSFQDVGHGNAVIDVFVSLHDNNLGVKDSEIKQFIDLFNDRIWHSKTSFAKYVDGSGKGSGWFTDGWIKLGRYSETLQRRIEKHTKGRTTQFFANGALNSKILNEL